MANGPPISIPSSSLNENAMIDMFKFKLISEMIGTKEEMSFASILKILLIIVLLGWVNKSFGSFVTKVKDMCIQKIMRIKPAHKVTDFKHAMLIEKSRYKDLLVYVITQDVFLNHKYSTVLSENTVGNSYSVEHLAGIRNHIFLSQGAHVIPIKNLLFNEKIWFFCDGNNNNIYLACNTSMGDIVTYLDGLESECGSKVAKRINYFTNDTIDGGVSRSTSTIHHFRSQKTFDNLFFEQKAQVLKIITQFLDTKWYTSRGIAHHLSFLLTGPPGTGKTSFIKAMANHLNRDIFNVDLSKITTKNDFALIMRENRKGIIIFEDFDRLPCIVDLLDEKSLVSGTTTGTDPGEDRRQNYLDRLFNLYLKTENKEEKDEALRVYKQECSKIDDDNLDLPFILNVLDGVLEYPGRILIFTANHPERLGDALLRPGRIDFVIEMKKASKAITEEILRHFYQYNGKIKHSRLADYKYTPSEIISVCKKCEKIEDAIRELMKDKIDVRANWL